MKQKVLIKNILIIILSLMIVGLVGLTAYTLSYFSDRKDKDVTITISNLNNTTLKVQNELSPSDLIAGKVFTKTVKLTNKANFNYYARFYAVVSSEIYVDNVKTTSEDIVTLTGVKNGSTSLQQGTDGKFYYLSLSSPTAITTSVSEISLNFTFQVSSDINEDSYTYEENGVFKTDNTLTTTITYYVEFVQTEGFNDWKEN